MFRFFIDKKDLLEESVRIRGKDYRHLAHSLRLGKGDRILVSTGDGWDYLVEISELQEEAALGRVLERKRNLTEPGLQLSLAQAIPKSNKMDLIVQKATEIGIKEIIPLETIRTIVRLEGKKRRERVERWQRIAREAAKQAGRGQIPIIKPLTSLSDLELTAYDLTLIPWEKEKSLTLKDCWHSDLQKVLLVIGPEGGFPEEEIAFLQSKGARAITLGPRILRTETAGLVAAAITLYEAGEMQ